MSCSCASYGSYIGNINCPSQPIPNLGLPCPPLTSVGVSDASNIIYTGPALACTGIVSGDYLDTILGKIDQVVCTSIGDFSSFNTFCLAPITTLQQFVETISSYVCDTQDQLNTFVGTTFTDYQDEVAADLLAITSPGITGCPSSGILIGDTLNSVLTKLTGSVCDIYDNKLSLSSVNWSQCFVVGTAPVTVAQGFSTVLAQICQLNTLIQTGGGGGGTLPTFNTIGSCLPSPNAADTLVDTVNKLIIRTCQAPTFDINALTWGCTTKPSTTTTDLQGAFQAVLTKLTTVSQNFPALYSSDFVVSNVDNGNPCAGKMISLSNSFTADRLVAATSVDTNPGTLQDKLVAGTGIGFDYFAVPGSVVVNNTATSLGDHKVASDATDLSPGYLIDKVEAGVTVNGITITPVLDPTTSKVQFNLTVDLATLFSAMLNLLTPGETITQTFCTAISGCPSPCSPPTNVTVTYNAVGLTTTTTTSTTTTTTTT